MFIQRLFITSTILEGKLTTEHPYVSHTYFLHQILASALFRVEKV